MLRQISGREGSTSSRRWGGGHKRRSGGGGGGGGEACMNGGCELNWKEMESMNMYGSDNGGMFTRKKRVMVVVDESSHSKHAMMWALTHVANKGDFLTLLQIMPSSVVNSSERPSDSDYYSSSSVYPNVAHSLGSLCKACKPEVEVEAVVIQGPKRETVMSQVKKLEVSVLVVAQKKPSPFLSCLCGTMGSDEFVEYCINNAECWTIGVRKQSKGMGGYLINTRWQKNFWLLA